MERREYLAGTGLFLGSAVAGCIENIIGGDDSGNREPAERKVPVDYRPAEADWIGRHHNLANNTVSDTATPPRSSPETEWTVSTETPVTALSVVGETVYAATFDRTYAISTSDGEISWTALDGGGVTVIDGRRYAIDSGTVRSMATDGDDEYWHHTFDERVHDVVELDQTVYTATIDGLVGLHPDTGDRRWTVGDDDLLQWGFFGTEDGRLHWMTRYAYRSYRLNGPEPPTEIADVSLREIHQQHVPPVTPSPPVVADNGVYSGGSAPDAAGVRKIGEEELSWYRRFEPSTSSPAVLDDSLVVAGRDLASSARESQVTESTLTALNRDSKTERWSTTVPEYVSYPVVADDVVLVGGAHPSGDDSGALFALDVESGESLWQRALNPGRVGYEIALTEDVVVVGTGDGVTALA